MYNFVENIYHIAMGGGTEGQNLRELKFRNWMSKIVEYLTFIELKIKTKDTHGLTDREENLWRVMHRVWYNGDFPIYTADNIAIREDRVTEQSLFNMTKVVDNNNGTEIDLPIENE